MGTRVPVVEHYNLRSANSYVGSSLHDLNADDIAGGSVGAGDDVGRGGDDVTDDNLDNDEESTAVVSVSCLISVFSPLIFFASLSNKYYIDSSHQ